MKFFKWFEHSIKFSLCLSRVIKTLSFVINLFFNLSLISRINWLTFISFLIEIKTWLSFFIFSVRFICCRSHLLITNIEFSSKRSFKNPAKSRFFGYFFENVDFMKFVLSSRRNCYFSRCEPPKNDKKSMPTSTLTKMSKLHFRPDENQKIKIQKIKI